MTETPNRQPDTSDPWEKFFSPLGKFSAIASLATIITAAIYSVLKWDSWDDAYPILIAASILALLAWLTVLRSKDPEDEFWDNLLKALIGLTAIVFAIGAGYWFAGRYKNICLGEKFWLKITSRLSSQWRALVPACAPTPGASPNPLSVPRARRFLPMFWMF